jgi:protein kinase
MPRTGRFEPSSNISNIHDSCTSVFRMDRYDFQTCVGSSLSSDIFEATGNRGDVVTVLKLHSRLTSWSEVIALPEVDVLRNMSHPNIIKLREVIRSGLAVQLVFERFSGSLRSVLESTGALREDELRLVMFQVFSGLEHLHRHGLLHHDIKPESIVCSATLESVKIAGFHNTVREEDVVRSPPNLPAVDSTPWYLAPEVLLGMPYGCEIDMWACGVLMAELVLNRPLFPGTSDVDQLLKQFAVVGSPSTQTWPLGLAAATIRSIKFNVIEPTPMAMLMPHVSHGCSTLIQGLLTLNSGARITAQDALRHAFFDV